MQPENRPPVPVSTQPSSDPPQPFLHPLTVLLSGRHPPEPPRGSRHQGSEKRHVIEKNNHMRRIAPFGGLIHQMIQSMAMRFLRGLALTVAWLAIPAVATDHASPPVQPATTFAAVEVHDKEKVAIAAEPYDTKQKESIFRVDYLGHGVMPVRLIVTNNGDKPISLRDARILFQTKSGERIQAAGPVEVERLMTLKKREGGRNPMPGPLPTNKLKPKASNKDIEDD